MIAIRMPSEPPNSANNASKSIKLFTIKLPKHVVHKN